MNYVLCANKCWGGPVSNVDLLNRLREVYREMNSLDASFMDVDELIRVMDVRLISENDYQAIQVYNYG